MSDAIEPRELRDNIRDVLSDRRGGVYSIPEAEGDACDTALWSKMADLGWLALPLPETVGGLGLGMRHLGVLYEELGRDLSAVPALPTMMAASALSRHDASVSWLEKIGAGEIRAAIALPATHDFLSAKDGRITGEVADVAFADQAGLLLLPVLHDGKMALGLFPADLDEVRITPRTLVDLTRTAADVAIDNVPARDIELVLPSDAGWAALLDHAAIGLASDAVGGSHALFEMTVEYLKTREQFGRPIGSFQALKHRAADWTTRIDAMTAHARNAAVQATAGGTAASAAASAAHVLACNTYEAFAADAIQLHGGIGFTWEHPCHLFLKRANFAAVMFGSVKDHSDRVAELLFEMRVDSAWLEHAGPLQEA